MLTCLNGAGISSALQYWPSLCRQWETDGESVHKPPRSRCFHGWTLFWEIPEKEVKSNRTRLHEINTLIGLTANALRPSGSSRSFSKPCVQMCWAGGGWLRLTSGACSLSVSRELISLVAAPLALSPLESILVNPLTFKTWSILNVYLPIDFSEYRAGRIPKGLGISLDFQRIANGRPIFDCSETPNKVLR